MDHELDPVAEELSEVAASRREFIKKAGVVAGATAWAVPTMQIINMAGASAQTNGSVVDTTRPPSSTTSTTHGPKCERFKMTAIWHCDEPNGQPGAELDGDGGCHEGQGYWRWIEKSGPCIDGYPNRLPPAGFYFGDDSDMYRASVWHKNRGCEIIDARTPYGDACMSGQIVEEGRGAIFQAPLADGDENGHGLYILEVLVECCEHQEDE